MQISTSSFDNKLLNDTQSHHIEVMAPFFKQRVLKQTYSISYKTCSFIFESRNTHNISR